MDEDRETQLVNLFEAEWKEGYEAGKLDFAVEIREMSFGSLDELEEYLEPFVERALKDSP